MGDLNAPSFGQRIALALAGFAIILLSAQTTASAKDVPGPIKQQPDSKGFSYAPPTAEELAPMRPEYLAELAKIHEPPEMADKPMHVRKAAPPNLLKLGRAINAVGAPDKATHEQRATAIRELLEIANSKERDDGVDRIITYGAVAAIACIDGAEPRTIIGYATNAIGDGDDALALRARMYLQAADRAKALDDLEKIMADSDGHALVGGDASPRKESSQCGWSIT